MTVLVSEKMDEFIVPEPNSGCWIWTGFVNPDGYAMCSNIRVHRFSYEENVEPIPHGLVIDHKCRVRCCVNPDHLECVTSGENVLRGIGPTAINANKTHCKYGHDLDENNTRVRFREGRVRRECRVCQYSMMANYRQKLREGTISHGR